MDKIYIKSQFIENINDILGKPYFDVIVLRSVDQSTSIKCEILLVCDGHIIMRNKVDTGCFFEIESELEIKILNDLMNELEKMMLKDLMFEKIKYTLDQHGRQIKTLRSCIFEIENNNG